MSTSNFDAIVQELAKQKSLMDTIKAENKALHQQLAALRAGEGIYVDINGKRIALSSLLEQAASALPVSTAEQTTKPSAALTSLHKNRTVSLVMESENLQAVSDERALQKNKFEQREAPVVEMMQPATTTLLPVEEPVAAVVEEEPTTTVEQQKAPTFLEEMMLDEFENALTSPLAVWDNTSQQPEKNIDEEQKAHLRRALIGSYILE